MGNEDSAFSIQKKTSGVRENSEIDLDLMKIRKNRTESMEILIGDFLDWDRIKLGFWKDGIMRISMEILGKYSLNSSEGKIEIIQEWKRERESAVL